MTLKTAIILLFKIEIIFTVLFNFCYTIGIVIWGYSRNVGDMWESIFNILLGISAFMVFIIIWKIVNTRIGYLLVAALFAYWWLIPAGHLLNSNTFEVLPGTYILMGLAFLFYGLNALLGILLFFLETFHLGLTHHSIIWGPWFTKFTQIREIKTIEGNKLKVVAHGILILIILTALSLPGFLQYANVYTIPIEITPKPIQSTFNFWANPDINGTYNDTSSFNGTKMFTPEILNALNKSYVNLDLTFGSVSNDTIPQILAWQDSCPKATFRIVLTPWQGLMYLYDLVKNATEIMMRLEANGSVTTWQGFAFDIEGDPFNYKYNFTSFDGAVAEWDKTFDYVHNMSIIRNKTIDMECISVDSIAINLPLGNTYLEQSYNDPSYTPQRFNDYAPMIYRCWHTGVQPYGSPSNSSKPWSTAYSFYTQMELLSESVPSNTLGVYIGITNCSCYGRVPQPEPITWGNATGLDNLIRDSLIAKSFGVKQITYFLDWDAMEDGYMMGGVFNSYGLDFLDVMNYWVNVNHSAHFYIYYKGSEATIDNQIRSDWIFYLNQPIGILEFIGLWIGTVLIVKGFNKKKNQ